MSNNEIDDIIVNGHIAGGEQIELVEENDDIATAANDEAFDAEKEIDDINQEEVLFDSLVQSVDEVANEMIAKEVPEQKTEAQLELSDVDTSSEFFDDFMEIFDSELSSISKSNSVLSEPPSLVKQELLKFEEALRP